MAGESEKVNAFISWRSHLKEGDQRHNGFIWCVEHRVWRWRSGGGGEVGEVEGWWGVEGGLF